MPFIPVANTCEFDLVYETPGGKAENTLYFKKDGGWALSDMGIACNELLAWWNTNVHPQTSEDVSLIEIKATNLTTSTSEQLFYTTDLPVAGGYAQAVSPGNVTLAITFRTSLRGRAYRGRNYLIGLAKASITGDTVHDDVVADFVASYTELVDGLLSGDAVWVVVSRYNGVDSDHRPIPREVGVTTPIVSVSSDGIVDSQRRRLNGRGE